MMLMSLRARMPLVAAITAAFLFAGSAGAQNDDYAEAQKLFRAGQHAQALERVDSFLKGNAKDARARFLKGLIFTEQNKVADAIRIFTGLTEDFPELPEPYNNLAVLYAQQGQYDKARSALELSIRTHPSYATAHENLGDIYAKMASQAYDKALQLDKANTGAQTKLGLIKELFSSSGRNVKPAAGKADIAKPTPTVVAAAKPVPVAAAVPAATTPAAPLKSVEPAPKPVAEPVVKPVEAAPKTAESAAKTAPAANASEDVLKAVKGWAQAWSSNDVSGYLGSDFKTPRGEPRGDWEASRKARIAKPKKIEVKVEVPKVSFTGANRVSVTFRQNYNSPNLKVSSMKTLVLVKSGGRWLIQQELVDNS
jgi:tetratricopeptide (TPR) repeat protein